jgi:STAS-like domain of unknown function (DUF4325)
MRGRKKTVKIDISEIDVYQDYSFESFDELFKLFDWSLKYKKVEFNFVGVDFILEFLASLIYVYLRYLVKEKCQLKFLFLSGDVEIDLFIDLFRREDWDNILKKKKIVSKELIPFVVYNSEDREYALDYTENYTKNFNQEYAKTLRYIVNEILYNTLEHGNNEYKIPSYIFFFWDEKLNEFSFSVIDVGSGIKQHLRQTYQNLSTDSEAILHSIKPQISGTFGRPSTGYETKNNAGVGLFFSSSIAQRLNADMFIVSGNGFVHISPTEIIAKELDNQWKGTFVYVKMKLGLIKDLNFQKMLAEITKSIPKAVKVTEENNLYISVMNYFGKYAEDKDLAKKIRDKYILPALAENKSLTIDFEDIVSAPHSLLNAMLATPIERLGLSAYKKIKIINAAPEIRETLDFIFDDNTSNA